MIQSSDIVSKALSHSTNTSSTASYLINDISLKDQQDKLYGKTKLDKLYMR